MSEMTLPLAGVTVLDLSRVLAGPYCTLMLADMGADVIKIESPGGGDDSRSFRTPSYHNESTYFLTLNRNKRSVVLDLKSEQGRDAFLLLVDKADVVVENYRTGVMERLGLGYEILKRRNPSLICCAISGYGRSGPNIDVPGYDPVAQAESGLMSMIGEPSGPPMRVGPSIVDLVSGLYAAQAISAALRQAAVSGEGRFIEVSLHETGMNMLGVFHGAHLIAGESPTRTGNANQVAQPINVYEAADGPFMMAAVTQSQFSKLCCDVIARPEWTEDERFKSMRGRLTNVAELTILLNEIFITRSRADWVSGLRNAGVPAGAVNSVAEVFATPQVHERDAVREVHHTKVGPYRVLRTPARLHETMSPAPTGAPMLGEHTREVLGALAGLSETAIDTLEKATSAITK